MAIDSTTTTGLGSTRIPETDSEAHFSEVDKMSYILRDMSMNALAKFEKLYQLPSNILSDAEKETIAHHFDIDLSSFRLAGTNISTVV